MAVLAAGTRELKDHRKTSAVTAPDYSTTFGLICKDSRHARSNRSFSSPMPRDLDLNERQFYAKQCSARMRFEDRIGDLCSAEPSRNRWPSRRTVAGRAETHRASREPSRGRRGRASARHHQGAQEASALPGVHPYSARAFPAERLKETITIRAPLQFSSKLRPRRASGPMVNPEERMTFKERLHVHGTQFRVAIHPRPAGVGRGGRRRCTPHRSEPSVAHSRIAYFAVIGGACATGRLMSLAGSRRRSNGLAQSL